MDGEHKQAVIQAKTEKISMNPGVIRAKETVTEKILVKGSKTN